MILPKALFGLFSALVLVGASTDEAGNPGCRLYVAEFLGGVWAECYTDGCPNPCTDDLVPLPGAPLTAYCPCGEWGNEGSNLKCLPKLVYSDPPTLGGGTPECESLCVGGCELLDLNWTFSPACTKCP